jgi:hypothetical protein
VKITRKAGKIEALRQTVKALGGATGRTGWFPSAIYEGGQPVAGVAYVQEFGSPSRGIPPRLGMRETATEKRQEWAKIAEGMSRAAALGKIKPNQVMEAVSMAAGGMVAATITKIVSPALKPATIAARKRRLADKGKSLKGAKGAADVAGIEKPEIDTGLLLATLSYESEGVIRPVREGKK